MTVARISLFFLIAAAFSCSEKESEEPWGNTGIVKGQIYLYSEFGATEPDQGGATLSFQSGSTSKSVTAGPDGKFVAEDIPMGTYKLVIEKQGFATRTFDGFRLVGGAHPVYTNMSIARPSTTKVTDLTIAQAQAYAAISGKVIHNNSSSYPFVSYIAFAGTTADVSSEKYTQASLYSFMQSSGTPFNETFYIDRNKFPSGSTMYVVIYGTVNMYSYDQTTGQYVYYGLGDTPSNVVSIVVP